jgi:hypothetical protein
MALADTMISTLVSVLVNSGKISEADIKARFGEFGEALGQVRALCTEVEIYRAQIPRLIALLEQSEGGTHVDGRTDQGGSRSGGCIGGGGLGGDSP